METNTIKMFRVKQTKHTHGHTHRYACDKYTQHKCSVVLSSV